MTSQSKIEWTTTTLNTVAGCTPQGPECANCYAMGDVHRFTERAYTDRPGLVVIRAASVKKPGLTWVPKHPVTGESLGKGARWTGELRCLPHRMLEPLSSQKGAYWFVNSVSDLFHSHLVGHHFGLEFIAANLGLFAITPQHRYQVLTKQPSEAVAALDQIARAARAAYQSPTEYCVEALMLELRRASKASSGDWVKRFQVAATDVAARWGARGSPTATTRLAKKHVRDIVDAWPLPNVHLGVSVGIPESKRRIDELRRLPAAVRFLSCEPLLADLGELDLRDIDWVIFGGESGQRARPCAIEWIRSGVAECRRQSVAVFVKQLGALPTLGGKPYAISDSKGALLEEWPEDLRIRDMPR